MTMGSLSPNLAEAVDFFVMRKFVECYDKCNEVICSAKCEPEQESNQSVIEASAALGIQALAETNQWEQAIAFICEVYGAVHLCPPRIIQVCILLHAHVKEYLPCHSLVQKWFENPHNKNNKQCAQVIKIYSCHILHPTGCVETLRDLVQSCDVLSEDEKASLLQWHKIEKVPELDDVCKTKSLPCKEGMSSNPCDPPLDLDTHYQDGREGSYDNNLDVNKSPHYSFNDFFEGCYKQLVSFLKAKLAPWQQRMCLLFMAVLAIMSLIQSQSGDPVSSLGRLVILWRTFLSKLSKLIV